MVEYAQLHDRLLIWVVDRHRLRFFSRRIFDLEGKVDSFVDALKKGQNEPKIHRLAHLLHHILIPSVISELPSGRVIYFVPDKSLNKVPFAALLNDQTGRYFVEDHPVAISPSLQRLQTSSRDVTRVPLKSALLVGNPSFDHSLLQNLPNLPDAETEIAAAGDSFEKVEVLNGEQATRCEILNQLDQFEVFGFAGHTVNDPGRPAQPCLLVAPSQTPADVGLLSGSDVQARQFHHLQLVVLSSCSSLDPLATRSEGWAGIANRFLEAGVPNVVGTLWNINDKESASLLPAFYQAIAQGKRPIFALQDMQVSALHSRSPRGWSSYEILVGHGAAVN